MFAFGRNWQLFVKNYLTDERIEEAARSLREFCGPDAINGKSFVDIGCGSGLFSLTALNLGAKHILSIDIDLDSVECCKNLRKSAGNPNNWEVRQASILDAQDIANIGSFDMVYSWGVLHHTGKMWQAVSNAASLVRPGGHLYIAIYNKEERFRVHRDGRIGSSRFWNVEKRIYSSLPWFVQNVIDYMLMSLLIGIYCVTFRNPVTEIRNHKTLRGMSWRTDIKDWLGGYPYEYATAKEVTDFVTGLGFRIIKVDEKGGLVNNEFLFQKYVEKS
jgi:2-polyprenyl-6-hydroxyphenyl methylase/3-demethylubiquinone-9 3-methyltransferase